MKNIKKTIQRIWYFVKNNLCIFLHKFLWKKQHTHILLALDMCWGTVDSFVFLRLKFDGFAWKQFSCHINYFFLGNLFYIIHCDSIISNFHATLITFFFVIYFILYTATPLKRGLRMAPKYFSSILCVKISADDRGIHNASCENRTPCVFPS